MKKVQPLESQILGLENTVLCPSPMNFLCSYDNRVGLASFGNRTSRCLITGRHSLYNCSDNERKREGEKNKKQQKRGDDIFVIS